MSFAAEGWAWEQECPGGSAAKLLLVYLGWKTNRIKGGAWPTMVTICRETQLSENTVRKSIRLLVDAGLLARELRKSKDGKCLSTMYHVPFVSISETDTPADLRGDTPADLRYTPADMQGVDPVDTRIFAATPPQICRGTPADLQGNPLLEPRTEKERKEDSSSPNGEVVLAKSNDFSLWWESYPLKKGKHPASIKYEMARRRLSADDLLHAVRSYPFDLTRPEFLPHAATWLHQRRWEDDYAAVAFQNEARTRSRNPPSKLAWLFDEQREIRA